MDNRTKPKEKILVFLVDDDASFLDLLKENLSQQDPDLIFSAYTSSKTALEEIESRKPDVVISDYHIPMDLNGIEFLRRIKSRNIDVPFIFLTGQGSEEVAAEALRLGAEDYFTKERGLAYFLKIAAAVRRAVGHRNTEREKNYFLDRTAHLENICQQLIENAQDNVILADSSARLISLNKKALEAAGYTLEEVRGLTVFDFVAPEEKESLRKEFAQFLAGQGKSSYRITFVGKQGVRRRHEATASMISPQGQQPLIIIITRDITEMVEEKESLAAAKNLLVNVIDAFEEVIHVVDRDLIVRYCNAGISQLSRGKVSSDAMMEKNLIEVFPFLKEHGITAEYREVFDSGRTMVTEETTLYEGKNIVTRTHKIPIRDGDGPVKHIVTVMRDITVETARQRSCQAFAAALADAGVGLAIAEQEGTIFYADERFASLIDMPSPDNLTGMTMHQILGDNSGAMGREMEASLEAQGRWTGRRMMSLPGSPCELVVNVRRLVLGHESRVCHLITLTCAADEPDARRELSQKTDELENLAKEYNSFVSMTSHELRSPLANIEGFARLLLDRVETLTPDEIKEFAARIYGNTVRLHTLIEDLLTYSRERRRALETETVDVKPLVAEAMENLRALIEETGAEIQLNLEADSLVADRQKLYGVIRHLLSNAVLYRQQNVAPRIVISSRREGDKNIFSVKDNGQGVLESERDTIFEPFRRGAASRGKPGSGLGLALARENIKRMGGVIWLESKPGEGAAFYFSIPLPRQEPRHDA